MAGDMQCFLFLKRKGIPVWVSVVCMSISQHRWYYCILWSWRARVSQCEKPHFCLTSWSTCWIKPIQLHNYSMFIAPGSWPIPSSNLKWLWTMAYLVQWYTVVYRIVWAWGFSWISIAAIAMEIIRGYPIMPLEDCDGQFGEASREIWQTWFGRACRTHDIIWPCGILYIHNIYIYILRFAKSQ